MVYMRYIVLCLLTVSLPVWALKGIYLGVRGGPCNPKDVVEGSGLGLDIGARVNKSYDLVGQFQTSIHNNNFSHWYTGMSGEMRIFRGMGDLELSLGLGAGLYSLSETGDSGLKPGVNLGVILDFVLDGVVHVGTMARYHAFSPGSSYGSSMSVWMIRVGYYFSLAPETTLSIGN